MSSLQHINKELHKMETKFDLTAEGCKTFTPGGSSKAGEGEPEFLTF